MDKEERIQQIARALKPAFRAYLLEQDGWEGITPSQRETLDAVLRDPTDRLLLGPLTGMMLDTGTGTDLEADAYYNIAVAIGVQEPERRGFFDDLTSGETYIWERDLATEEAPGGGRFVREETQPDFETGGDEPAVEEPEPPRRLGPPIPYNYPDVELSALGGDVAEGIAAMQEALRERGIGGGDGGGGVSVAPAPEEDVMLPEDWEQAAQEQYGAYWAIFKYNPELKQLLLDATQQDWSDDKFRAAIEATTWWKTTTESARVFDMEEATDPATVQTKIDNRAMELKNIALNQGVTLSDETAAQIARDSLRGGWSYQTYTTAVTAEAVKSTAGLSQLRAGAIGEKIRQTAYDYGISLSDTEINTYVNKFAVGEESDETFEGKMREWAKVLYPAISSNLDSGSTFQDVIDPYKSKAAALLELEPDQIDFLDSKYLAAITKTNDKGEQSMMSAREWEQELRTNRSFGYEFTQRAQSDAYRVADQIADLFGRV